VVQFRVITAREASGEQKDWRRVSCRRVPQQERSKEEVSWNERSSAMQRLMTSSMKSSIERIARDEKCTINGASDVVGFNWGVVAVLGMDPSHDLRHASMCVPLRFSMCPEPSPDLG
jgi:hypothetical protein